MVKHLFAVQIARADGLLEPHEISAANALAIKTDLALNPLRVPYSRPDKRSLDVLHPDVYAPIFAKVKAFTQTIFGCKVSSLIGRESVFHNGQHLPVHVEGDSHLSGVLWLDWTAQSNPEQQDYNGLFCLQNPSGVFGFKSLPFEQPRSTMEEPRSGSLVIHPSYVPHFVFPYQGKRPGVEIHFEILVEKKR